MEAREPPRIIFMPSRKLRRPTLELMSFVVLNDASNEALRKLPFDKLKFLAFNDDPYDPITTRLRGEMRAALTCESCCLRVGGCLDEDALGCMARKRFVDAHRPMFTSSSSEYEERLRKKAERRNEREREAAESVSSLEKALPARSKQLCGLWKKGKKVLLLWGYGRVPAP